MTACEKCWEDAYWLALLNGTQQVDEYRILVAQGRHPTEAELEGGNA